MQSHVLLRRRMPDKGLVETAKAAQGPLQATPDDNHAVYRQVGSESGTGKGCKHSGRHALMRTVFPAINSGSRLVRLLPCARGACYILKHGSAFEDVRLTPQLPRSPDTYVAGKECAQSVDVRAATAACTWRHVSRKAKGSRRLDFGGLLAGGRNSL